MSPPANSESPSISPSISPTPSPTLATNQLLLPIGIIAAIVIGATLLLMCCFFIIYHYTMKAIIKRRKRNLKHNAELFARDVKLKREGMFVINVKTGQKILTLPPAAYKPPPQNDSHDQPLQQQSGRNSFVKFHDRLKHDNPNMEWEAFDCKTPSSSSNDNNNNYDPETNHVVDDSGGGERIRVWVNNTNNEVKIQRFNSHKRKVKKHNFTSHGGFIVNKKGEKMVKMENKKPLERTSSFINFSATLEGPETAYDVFQDDKGSRYWVHKETKEIVYEDPTREQDEGIPGTAAGFGEEFKNLLVQKLSPTKKKQNKKVIKSQKLSQSLTTIDETTTTSTNKPTTNKPKLRKEGSYVINEQNEKVVHIPSSSNIVTVHNSPPLNRTGSFKAFISTVDNPENWEAFEDSKSGNRYWINKQTLEVRNQDPTQREAGRLALSNA
jgi:hypothetical protein